MAERPRMPIDTSKREGFCFGCGPNNPAGLKLSFKWDGRKARAEFTPTRFHQGWSGIVHGGIIAVMLDEAMGHATRFSGYNDFLTAQIKVNLKRPALIGEPLVIISSITKKEGKLVRVKAKVSLPDGTVVAEGKGTQVIMEKPLA